MDTKKTPPSFSPGSDPKKATLPASRRRENSSNDQTAVAEKLHSPWNDSTKTEPLKGTTSMHPGMSKVSKPITGKGSRSDTGKGASDTGKAVPDTGKCVSYTGSSDTDKSVPGSSKVVSDTGTINTGKVNIPGTGTLDTPMTGKVTEVIKAIESNQLLTSGVSTGVNKITVTKVMKGGVELSKVITSGKGKSPLGDKTKTVEKGKVTLASEKKKKGAGEGSVPPQKLKGNEAEKVKGLSPGKGTLETANKNLASGKVVRRSGSVGKLSTTSTSKDNSVTEPKVKVNKDAGLKGINKTQLKRQTSLNGIEKSSSAGSGRSSRKSSVHSLDDEVFDTTSTSSSTVSSSPRKKTSNNGTTNSNAQVQKSSSLKNLVIDRKPPTLKNPLPPSPSTARAGRGGVASKGVKSSPGRSLEKQGVFLPQASPGDVPYGSSVDDKRSSIIGCQSPPSGSFRPPPQAAGTMPSHSPSTSSLSSPQTPSMGEPKWPTGSALPAFDEAFLKAEFEEWAALQREWCDIWGPEVESGGGERTPRTLRRHRKEIYKRKLKAAGIKETYYGFDDDRSSVDSEMSTSSRLSSSHMSLDNTFDEDDMFDEFTREEFLRNYQRLAKEHLELEKSNALLHNQAALSHVDPQREQKLRSQLENDLLSAQSRIEDLMKIVQENGQDVSWLDEKELLNNTITTLKEKISEHEVSLNDQKVAHQDQQEQNEELEFRCLELEEVNKKLIEDAKQSLTFTGPVTLSNEGVLELYAEEEGLIAVRLEDLKLRLQELTELQNGHFSRDEQVVLLQTYALLNIADQKLKEHQTEQSELKTKLTELELERESLREAGVSKELANTYNETKAKLEAAELRITELTTEVEELKKSDAILIKQLSTEVEELKKSDAVHKYTEDFNQKTEERYKGEISALRRQLSTSQEGRDYENELLAGKLQQQRELEQRVSELETENKDLQASVEEARQRAAQLQERLTMEQDTQELTESEQDTSTLLHNLRTKLSQHEKSEHELSEKNDKLVSDLATLRKRLTEYEQIEAELTEKTFTLQQDVESSKTKQRTLEDDLKSTKDELLSYQSQISVGSSRVRASREDLVSMGSIGSIGSMSENDLNEDNQSMRMELFSLREQLKSSEQEVERMRRSATGGGDVQWKVKSLEKELMDLKHENVTLKERLREKMKELDTVEEELGCGLRDKKAQIKVLEGELEQARVESNSLESLIVEMKKDMFSMQEKLDLLEGGTKAKDMLKLQASNKNLEESEEMLREELEAMNASHAVLKENAESLLRREEEYDKQITELHQQLKAQTNQVADLEATQEALQEEKSDLLSQLEALKSSSTALNTSNDMAEQEELIAKLKEDLMAKEKELEARDELEMALNEKDNRIKFLQEQIDRMEDSENKLNSSLTDVEQLEGQLREQLLKSGTLEVTGSSTGSFKEYEMELTQLRVTEERLLGRIDELEESEKSLRVQLADTKTLEDDDEPDVDSKSEDDSSSANSKLQQYKKRCRNLEARVKELAGHESDLMEQIYAMQLENQELQEHIDLLQDGSDHEAEEEEKVPTPEKAHKQHTSAPLAPTERLEVVDKVAQLEEANKALKDELLKAKLGAMDTLTSTFATIDPAKYAELQGKVAAFEKREEEFTAQIETIQSLEKKITQLEEHRSEMEAELEEHATGERKLQQKIEILEQSEDKLMEELDTITLSERTLKEEIETLKLTNSSGQQGLLGKIRKLEDQERDLKDEITDLQSRRDTLTEKLDDARKSETSEVQRLQDKVDILLDTEEKLIDRLQEQDAVEADLKSKLTMKENDIEKLNAELSAHKKEIDELRPLVEKMAEADESIINLKQKIEEAGEYSTENLKLKEDLKEKDELISELETKLSTIEKDHSQQVDRVKVFEEEIVKLITKLKSTEKDVDELTGRLTTSEAETSKLQEELKQMEVISEAKSDLERVKEQCSKQINELEEEITQLYEKTSSKQKEIEQLQDKLSKMDEVEKALAEAEDDKTAATRRITELEDTITSLKAKINDFEIKVGHLEGSEKSLKEMINDLEKSEAVYLTKIDSHERTLNELRSVEESLRQQLAEYQHNEGSLTARLVTLEKEEVKLQTKVNELESHNSSLISTISGTKTEPLRRSPSPRRVSPKPRSRTPSPHRWGDMTNFELLEGMSREELVSKVHELESMERFHRSRIHELNTNLSQLRQAVETATVCMETGTDVPISLRSQTKDAEYEAKVAEMVRTEVNLKMKILHLQRQDSLLRSELAAAEEQMHGIGANFRTEVEELEEELDEARKSEARWKNKLQYGQVGQENQALAKVEHLESLVFDLEASERKLQREVNMLQESEQRLTEKLKTSEASQKAFEIPVNENDKYYDIIQQVMLLDASGKELSEKITKIERDDTATLKRKVADLEMSEKGLLRKVELLESQEPKKVTFAALQGSMDTPEDILKKRVSELENMEQHSRKQIIELERDREELHEQSRNDKGTIHELNVHVRELEMAEKNLKDQINRLEASEGRLSLTIDDLNERIQQHQSTIQMLQSSEKQLKFALEEQKSGKNDLSLQLQNISEDWKNDEQRFKKKIADLEGEKMALTERIDELTDRVGDLEGVEISMKSKVKILENAEMNLKSASLELEHSESESKSRALELEALNETLSQKLHSIQEEKSNIMFELSDLQSSKESLEREVQQLKSTIDNLKERLADSENGESDLVKKIEEQAEREMSLMSRLNEFERMEVSGEEKVKDLEENESKLRLTIQQLEGSISMLNSRVQSYQDVEKENAKLLEELRLTRAASQTLNGEKLEVQQKLEQYQTAHNNNDMLTIPREELSTLKAQVKLLEDMERSMAEYEKSEKNLKATVQKLRQGKDACGHEMEIKELKDEINNLNSIVKERDGLKRALNTTRKAHELLKENHEATKQELNQLLNRTKSGSGNTKTETSNRAVQARLSQTYNLKGVSPELRMALKGLGARYPDAYQEFVRTLQPSQVAQGVREHKHKEQLKKHQQEQLDAMIVPATNSSLQAPPMSSSPHSINKASAKERPTTPSSSEKLVKFEAIRELVDQLPMADVPLSHTEERDSNESGSSIDESPVAGLDTPQSTLFKVGIIASSSPRRDEQDTSSYSVVEEYVESSDLEVKTSGVSKVFVTSEDPLWATIEGYGASIFSPGTDQEESYWANIENSSDVDDLTVCLTFAEETDALSRSSSSLQSDGSLPPLPTTLPPTASSAHHFSSSPAGDSYYLPNTPGDDSADEAPDLDEDSHAAFANKRRAQSVERDSDFSELLPLGASPQQRRKKKLGANTSSLDSIPDSGMGTLRQSDADFLRERIALLEKQLKTREKELEVFRINQREFEKKSKDAAEAATLKVKLSDHERQLDAERHRVADLRTELSQVQLQLGDRETDVRRLRADVDRLQNTLKAAPSSTDADSSEKYLREQLERKEKEISAKSYEVDRLIQEMRKLQDESRSAQDEHQGVLAELTTAQLELQTHRSASEQLTQLAEQHQALKKEYDDLVAQHEQFSTANEEKSALEKIVLKLRGQLKDLERIDLERQTLETKAKALENELKLTKETESELTKENAKMRHRLDQLTKDNEHMNATHVTYTKVIAKYKNMEQIKNKAQLMVTPLRAKAIRLSQKCKEKDNLIERLAEELGRSGEPSDLIAETDRVKAVAASEEYNRPASPLPAEIFEDEVPVIATEISGTYSSQTRLRTTSAGSSAGSSGADSLLDDDHGYHDNDDDAKMHKTRPSGKRGKADGKVSRHSHHDVHSHNNGGLTIDDLVVSPSSGDVSLQPVTLLETGRDVGETSTWPRKKATHVPTPPTTMYQAVKDYDPEYFSQSGQKHREVALQEGQHVRILGCVDKHGYYEADVDGKIGLVPAKYLEPIVKDSQRKHHTLRTKPVTQNGSPEQILALHSQLQQSHVPHHQVLPHQKTNLSRVNTIVHPAFVRRPTVPPVQRSTTLPRQRPAPKHPAALNRMSAMPSSGLPHNYEGLLMTAPMRRSLPALPPRPVLPPRPPQGAKPSQGVRRGPYGGQSTPPVDPRRAVRPVTVRAPPEPPSNFRIERVVGDNAVLLAWQPPQMDELARSNGAVVKGYTIYINNRDKQKIPSPHMPKALVERLNLRRPNRFSIQSTGEGGLKSRVVDVLFEDLLPPDDREATGDGDNSSVVSSGSQQDDGQRRVFMAVYDYNPSEHSPHDCPSDELSFRAGEVITAYGSVNAEGFYHAKLHGRKGLVPASFIEEVSLLRSHSKRSLTGSNSQPGSRPHSRVSGERSAPNSQPGSRSGSRPGSRPNSIHGGMAKVATAPVS